MQILGNCVLWYRPDFLLETSFARNNERVSSLRKPMLGQFHRCRYYLLDFLPYVRSLLPMRPAQPVFRLTLPQAAAGVGFRV